MIKQCILILALAVSSLQTFAQHDKQYWIDRYISVSYPLDKMEITSPFGTRRDPFNGKATTHQGTDLRARFVPVYAVMQGEVLQVGFEKRGGTYVTIRHGHYTVSYCHLSQTHVRKGQTVQPGEVVATSGNSGSRSTAPHLHVSLKYKGKAVNPAILFEFIKGTREEAVMQLAEINENSHPD